MSQTGARPILLYAVSHARWFLTHRLPLARAARERGFDVHVAAPRSAEVAEVEREGFVWHEVPVAAIRREPFGDARTFVSLYRLYRRLRPALVHHVTLKPVVYGSLAARLTRVRAVVNAVAGLGEPFARGRAINFFWRPAILALMRAAFRHPRMTIILQNADDRDLLVKAGVVELRRTAVVRGAGVDSDVFRPFACDRAGDIVVAYAGRFTFAKGLREIAAASRLLRSRGHNIRFLLAGEPEPGRSEDVTPHLVARWVADGLVEHCGHLEDVRELLRRADIFCAPSYEIEGIPKAVIEAAASGLPVVTTDTPGCREIVRDGVNGLLVPPRDPEALANAIEKLASDAQRRAEMGRYGRQIAEAEFGVERVVQETLAVYRALLDPDKLEP